MEDRDNELTEKENDELNYIDSTEEEEERKGLPFILIFLFTTVGVLFALGLSFSTINLLERNETINSLISKLEGEKKYVITYSEGVGGKETCINLINQFPIPDYQGKQFDGMNEVYNFSLLISDNTEGLYYQFTALPNSNNTLNSSNVKIYLTKNGTDVDFSYKNNNRNNKVKVFTDYEKVDADSNEIIIYSDKITKNDVEKGRIDFVMRMWVADDTVVDDDFMNKTFGVKVNTYVAESIG